MATLDARSIIEGGIDCYISDIYHFFGIQSY
jgi:hypothetical protein